MNIPRLLRSVAHLRPSMILWRIHRTIKGPTLRMLAGAGLLRGIARRCRMPVEWNAPPATGTRYHCEDIDIAAHRFTFLNSTVVFPEDPAGWQEIVAREPLLWQFHFCYHDWLPALLRNGDCSREEVLAALDFAVVWSGVFPPDAPAARICAWHPYVLSIRIEAWIRLVGIARDRDVDGRDHRIQALASGVACMTRVLLRNLEFGTMANHLMRNIKALVMAGVFLRSAPGSRALRRGLALLDRELRDQVLADGCHFERSPMYHASVLNDVQDMLEMLTGSGRTAPRGLIDAQQRMTGFLGEVLCPDGDIPHFNDSTSSFFITATEVLERGRMLARLHPGSADGRGGDDPHAVSGLLVHRHGALHLVFDAGDVGPDHQPGHAHCDTLSFELSVHGQRVITDTGVFHYRASPERTYSRSTAAHNTLMIDGREQSEVWGSFRVGRRARTLGGGIGHEGAWTLLRGAHDGYARPRPGVIHERCIAVLEDSLVVIVDWIHGRGEHRITGHLHLHPRIVATLMDGRVECADGDDTWIIVPPEGSAIDVPDTEYYPGFGFMQRRKSIRHSSTHTAPGVLVTIIRLAGEMPVIRLDSPDGMMQISAGPHAVSLQPVFRPCTSST